MTRLRTPGKEVSRPRYDVEITLAYPRVFRVPSIVRATGTRLWHLNCQAIVGRDVLRYCRFHYDGPNGIFTFDFDIPSADPGVPHSANP